MLEHTKSEKSKSFFFPEMRLYFPMFITALCFLFLPKMKKRSKELQITKNPPNNLKRAENANVFKRRILNELLSS